MLTNTREQKRRLTPLTKSVRYMTREEMTALLEDHGVLYKHSDKNEALAALVETVTLAASPVV